MTGKNADENDMHRVKFVHELVHERLVNWARWCNGGRGGSSSSPMFRHYKAPRYRNAVEEEIHVPVDGLDAADVEKVVGLLPEQHRDAIRWFYVYSHRGIGLWQAVRALAVQRDMLTKLIHDGRSMVKNRLDQISTRGTIAPQLESAPAAPASLREAEVSAKREEKPAAKAQRELHPA